jgi:hypothetical protein
MLLTLELTPLPVAAQPIERPTDCTESMSGATIFIGHDCGEWASVMIVGNIIIRKPWSRANRANRGVRLRLRREGAPIAVVEPTRTPARTPPPTTAVIKYGIDVSGGSDPDDLDCEDFDTQTEAQGWSATNDPEGLDASRRDDDGIPCEHLP